MLRGDNIKASTAAAVKSQIEEVVVAAESAPSLPTASITNASGTVISLPPESSALLPLIVSFESQLQECTTLYETLAGRLELLSCSIVGDNGDLYERIQTMAHSFTSLCSEFKSLEQSFEDALDVTSRSGQLISSLAQQERRDRELREILQIYIDLRSGKGMSKLDAIIDSTSFEVRKHGSKVIKRLKTITDARIPGGEHAEKNIEELATWYEQRLLREFHEAFEQGDMASMRVSTSLLTAYNGGQSCIQSFVSQHAFFAEPTRPEAIMSVYHPSLPPVVLDFSKPPVADSILTAVYDQIAETVDADWKYLEAVFEEPIQVMNYLLQRVFRETVQVHIDEILKQAKSHSLAAYLRCLFANHKMTRQLIERIEMSIKGHLEGHWSSRQHNSIDVPAIMNTLNNQLESLLVDLFTEYTQPPQKLVEAEAKAFSDLSVMALTPVQAYVNAKKGSKSKISAVFGMNSGSAERSSSDPVSDALNRAKLYCFTNGQSLISMDDCRNGILDEAVFARLFALHAEMTARLYTLLRPELCGLALEESFKLLLKCVTDRYIEPLMLLAYESSESTSKGFDPRTFDVIYSSSRILSLLLSYCQSHFLPVIVSASPVAYRNMVQVKTEASAKVTERTDKLLRKELESAILWIEEAILSKQRKSDYKPRPDDLEAMAGPTQACQALCNFCSLVCKTVVDKLDSTNATTWLAEFGSALHARLLNHLKQFTVSDMGSMVLQSDLRRYRDLLDKMGPAKELLKDRFEMLFELGHIFMVRPDNLRSILSEGYLANIDSRLLYPYIGMRGDFASANIRLLFPDMERTFNLFS